MIPPSAVANLPLLYLFDRHQRHGDCVVGLCV